MSSALGQCGDILPTERLGGLQTNEVAAGDPVKDASDLRTRIGAHIGIGHLAPRRHQVEAQPVSADPARAPLARIHCRAIRARHCHMGEPARNEIE